MTIAPNAPTLAVSGNISAFNIGISLGPWLGGLVLASGHSYPTIPAIGAAIAGLAVLLWGCDLVLQARQLREKHVVQPAVKR